ncbi:hypothetical protein CTEN210_12996 [Chaetoceros tenuissimus]|uniref:Uncharacterized protein n=1 Tax=Chaetoceros tenuissimus TaxID=426638 RepID=A0AAD3D4F4_9STRA|nr:hypothetical protein CTEN210_12996 [Chaetoceros tenuissimus]
MKENRNDKEEVQDSLPIEGTQEIESNDYLLSPKKSEPSLLTSIETENNDHLAQSSHDGYSAPENVNKTSDKHISPTGNEEKDHYKYESSFSNPQHSILQTNCIEENERRSLFEAAGQNENVEEDDESRSTFLSCLRRHKVTLGLLCFVLLIGVSIGITVGQVSRNLNRDIVENNSPSSMPSARPSQSLSTLPSIGLSQSPSKITSSTPSLGSSSVPSHSSMRPSTISSNLPTSENPSSGPSQIPSFSPSSMPSSIVIGSIASPNSLDRFAYSTALSADGKTLAVGAPETSDGYLGPGNVYVYYYDGFIWMPKGQTLGGERLEQFGSSVSLSGDGNTLAVGAPNCCSRSGYINVYSFDEPIWKLRHSVNEKNSNRYGYPVLLSFDGNVLAVGQLEYQEYQATLGQVHAYSYSNDSYLTNKGWAITCPTRDDLPTYNKDNFSLSPDGNTIAIGSNRNDGTVPVSGQVHIYYFNGYQWELKGNIVNGQQRFEMFGYSVSLSFDGNVVAIGAPEHRCDAGNSGQVQIYEYNGQEWQLKGNTIQGHTIQGRNLRQIGKFVSLSTDGNIVAFSSHMYPPQIHIYTYHQASWQLTDLVDCEETVTSVSLSSDFMTLAVGYEKEDIGRVKVYQVDLK